MKYDSSKAAELYILKAENFDEKTAPNQKKYYREAAGWLAANDFDSAEEATEAMKHTEYYEGAGIAKIADDIELRIKAMEDVGYDDVAEIHRQRREKFRKGGNAYAFSQEWIDDFNRAAEKAALYAERKEAFGKIFSGYFQIAGNPQREHRKEAAKGITEGLKKLEELGVTFDELASQRAYIKLTMLTEKGMSNFVDFVHDFIRNGCDFDDDISDISEEQEHIARWAAQNKAQLAEVGKMEKWHFANCVAVPSESPEGYDFIDMREVDC